jgi:hypothetical protein
MTLPPPKVCRLICRLHALIGSSNANEAATALGKLSELLANNGLTWNDLPIIFSAVLNDNDLGNSNNAGSQAATDAPRVNVLDLVLHLLERHIAITAEERMAVALWILHTYVFDRFPITPRLALLSPVRGCGKTTLLVLVELLVASGFRTDNVTASAIYHHLDHKPHITLLVDEGDNLDLFGSGVLRAVFNAGHRRGGSIDRFVGGRPRKFHVFAPLAVAAIGTLPLPLLHRSIPINMQRPSGDNQIERLEESDPQFLASRSEIRKWVARCTLARDPEMPSALRDRAADNWRVLLAIADDLGHGDAARSAAIKLSSNCLYEDAGVKLLSDIRSVFQLLGKDRIASAVLVEALLGLDDGIWGEWRGPNDDRLPRKLSQSELARLLRPFQIRSKTIWPARRGPRERSKRGYLRNEFEPAWRAYCPPADTPTQASKIIQLRRKL